MRIVLASKSPRRRQILSGLFSDFEIITAQTDETLPDGMHPQKGVEILARRKGEAVLSMTAESALVISSDTLVEIDGEPLGKPESEADAEKMLKRLSGNVHRVHTGIAVHYRGACFSGVDTSEVRFHELSDVEISEYVKGGEPMDKAGSYAIQGEGGKFVKSYSGEFDSIVGLSVILTKKLIDEALASFGDKYE